MPGAPEIDVIRDLLSGHRLSATVYAEVNACGSWNLGDSSARKCVFHVVARGTCWMHLRQEPPVRLEAGDLALLPRNAWHTVDGAAVPGSLRFQALDETAISITCGYFELDDARADPLLQALPDLVVVRARDPADRKRIAELADLLAGEALTQRTGDSVVLDKLVEMLLVLAVRGHLKASEDKRGLLATLTDPRVGRALAAMHREPERRWHVNTLATLAAMSRTAFAEAFSERVGMPPMRYLAQLRMRRAADLLKDRRNSVGGVAAQLGYRSEAAFRRAFKRVAGLAPGAVRRAARS